VFKPGVLVVGPLGCRHAGHAGARPYHPCRALTRERNPLQMSKLQDSLEGYPALALYFTVTR
jgi:hypothetical protein